MTQAERSGEDFQAVAEPGSTQVPPVLRERVALQGALPLSVEPQDFMQNPNGVNKFDLFKHPACVGILMLLSVLITYTITDSLPLGETYVAGPPYWLFLLMGGVISALTWVIGHAGRIPRIIALGLALVAGVVGTAMAHPAMLRVNALTDSAPLQLVEYRRTSANHFEALQGDWPNITLTGAAYWRSMQGEVRRAIPMRRGGLGFYQADLTAIRFELEISGANDQL